MKDDKKIGSISTFLGFGSRIEGNVEFQGTIRLDGQVTGKISSKSGTLIVGERAVVDADIRVDTIIIMGDVSGTVEANERIEVRPPGRLSGDVRAGVISIESGGIFNGKCAMKTKTGTLKKPETSTQIPPVSEPSKGN